MGRIIKKSGQDTRRFVLFFFIILINLFTFKIVEGGCWCGTDWCSTGTAYSECIAACGCCGCTGWGDPTCESCEEPTCDYSPSCTNNGKSCGNCGTYTGCSTACDGGCTGCTCSGDKLATGTACSSGSQCCSGYCIAGFCRSACSSTYNGALCSSTTTSYTTYGICTSQTGIGWSCDTSISAYNTNYLYQCSDSSATYGTACDSNSLAGGYSVNGVCGGSSHGTCYTNYASDVSSSLTASAIFGTEGTVCASAYNGYYCDAVSDGSFSPGNKRCDGSDTTCRTCTFSTFKDNENLCEYGCGANVAADEKTSGACDSNVGYINGSCSYFSDGDYNQSSCDCIAGEDNWGITGDSSIGECCGDDIAEFPLLAVFDEEMNGVLDNTISCCPEENDCVNASDCFSNNTVYDSVDLNTDDDYCLEGVWYDCLTNADCPSGEKCYSSTHECISSDGFIKISNLGVTGIEDINVEYTSIRSVVLHMNFTDNSTYCRYINHDDPYDLPEENGFDWHPWEPCIKTRVWILSEESGNKTVYYQLNYTNPDRTVFFNDSIYYNYTGAGLDTTPPTEPTILDGDYTNNNQSVTISWYGATDPESEIFEIPLQYEYVLYHENGTILDTYFTDSTTHTSDISSYYINHSTLLYVNITVINSAWLSAKSTSDGLRVDLQAPIISSLRGDYYNLSNQQYETILGINNWVYANSVNFSWEGVDYTSPIAAYSYILTSNPNSVVDNVPEGAVSSFAEGKTKTFTDLRSGTYYFYIKAKDEAGNWGEVSSMNFSIDNTPPGKPGILTEEREGTDVTYIWSESSDPETGIEQYMINLSYPDGSYYKSNITDSSTTELTFVDLVTGSYSVLVGAMNGVGLWRWSNEGDISTDSTPPEIKAIPNRTVIINTPILMAWTDEQAYCVYNISDTEYEFAYTNTTYHEAKADYLGEGGHYVTITCEDVSGNEASLDLNFTINTALMPDVASAPLSINSYQNTLTTFSINIEGSGNLLAGIKSDRFSMQLDGEDREISVFDKGDGSYNISFYSPEEPNAYNMILNIDENQIFTATLTNQAIYLAVAYTKWGLVPLNTSHMSYYSVDDNAYGLASDEGFGELMINSGRNNLSLSNIRQGENLFIFSTKSGLSVNSREELLESGNFMKKIVPSFGHQLDDTYIIHFILRYDSFAIESEIGDELEKGKYSLLIKNIYSDEKGKIKRFIKRD